MSAFPQRLPEPSAAVDLTNCDREQIHVPGIIQPHGFLLALADAATSAGELVVRQASASAADFLGRPMESILGHPLAELLPAHTLERIARCVMAAANRTSAEFIFEGPVVDAPDSKGFEVVFYRSGPLLVLEFEVESEPLNVDALNADVYGIISRIPSLTSVEAICATAATELRRLTGFDRVMLYRFDEEGAGIVLAEDRNEELPSYLHLQFPASDIPQQARRLYVMNRVRIIPDVNYAPSPLMAAPSSAHASPLDLSGSILRSVSPIHRDYMRNMGTVASMSISLVIDGALWGLISLHHHEPRFVPYRLRASCDLLTQFFSAQLTAEIKAARLTRTVELRTVQRRLLTHMATADRYLYSLTDNAADLLELTSAHGARRWCWATSAHVSDRHQRRRSF